MIAVPVISTILIGCVCGGVCTDGSAAGEHAGLTWEFSGKGSGREMAGQAPCICIGGSSVTWSPAFLRVFASRNGGCMDGRTEQMQYRE